MEHYDNGNDGLEDGSTQDAILSDSEESESVSEESTQLTQLKIESQLEMISTHFYLRNMPDGRSFIALLSIQHYIKDGYVEYVPNMENLAENGALNKCIGESNKNL